MKHTKDRVIALDYFRGLCILIVLLSHSYMFSMPFSYLSGLGRLWTSAAEMFFLLSGITFGIVRGPKIISDFKTVLGKSWRRAGGIYLLHIGLVCYAIVLGLFCLSHNLTYYGAHSLPAGSGMALFASIATFNFTLGWADFLMYYSVFLLIAPFALYALRTRVWFLVPLTAVFIYSMSTFLPHGNFAQWQLYFFAGLTLARFRQPITSTIYSLPALSYKFFYRAVATTALAVIFISTLLAFPLSPYVNKLVIGGWLPAKFSAAYIHLLNHQHSLDNWLQNGRAGPLRPAATLIILLAAYLFYQKHKDFLLKYSGRVVNKLGSGTLYIYIAQAVVIPIIVALPIRYGGLAINFLVTSLFFYAMWLVTQRQAIRTALAFYLEELRQSYNQAKYSYLQRYEDV